jgi:116 kDa U5 small nuclear ribonucleoprotein component
MADSEEGELYDEFGNYIGPDLDDTDDDDDSHTDDDSLDNDEDRADGTEDDHAAATGGLLTRVNDSTTAMPTVDAFVDAIVLHEDKDHYPSAEQVYGEDVRTAVLDEDAMDLETPILVEPGGGTKNKNIHAVNHMEDDSTTNSMWLYSDTYLGVQLANETTRTRRGVALIGHFHHGKTCLVDFLLQASCWRQPWSVGAETARSSTNNCTLPRYTDTLQTEQVRQMSLVSTPLTTLLPDSRGKTYCVTLVDCPGHVNFHDETVAALRIVDGAVLVLDVVEGIMMHTEMAVRQAISEGLPIVVVISKMDRMLVELKLPPRDAYFKLQHLLDEVNELVGRVSRGRYPKLSPERGNVAFSSALHGWLFTLESFAQVYLDHSNDDDDGLGVNLSVQEFGKRLWGDSYLDPETRTFHPSPRDCTTPNVERTFVAYVLGPLYKIYAACLGEREVDVNKLLRSVGVLLNKEQLRASAEPLLRAALSQFLQTASSGWVDMIVRHIPHPAAAAKGKIARCYTGPLDSPLARAMMACDPDGPLVMHAVKNYASADGQSFWTLARIYSGTVRPVTLVHVLGEGYSPNDDDEDAAAATVQGVAIPRGRTRMNVGLAKAGNWVLLEGVDANIAKTATIVSPELLLGEDAVHIFAPLKFPQAGGEAVMKLAIEPLNPSELPKMVEGLRRVSKAYPMAKTKVEEGGEHVVLGTGELYLDCLMHDLRLVYSDIEVKVADPIVSFRETVVETSTVKCFAETANKRNKLTFIAEPLDEGLAERLEAGHVSLHWDKKKLGRFFQTQYDWDLLSSRSVWAFGDSATHGTNILLDDTLPSEVDKTLLGACKSSIVQGFQWATREGPLCEEPVRGTKIKILDVTLADKPIYRGGGQIIPTSRRTVHSSLLMATPRLMEPIYRLQIECPGAIVDAIQPVLARRRGHIVQDRPIAGSTLCSVKGFLPVLDSFGFETDLRTFTQGQAMVFSVFDHWAVVPGDPLDRSIILHPLEPSPPQFLARELLVKTRRRKGLSEDVSMSKFFDEGMKAQLDGGVSEMELALD